jgi:hypothetical protein
MGRWLETYQTPEEIMMAKYVALHEEIWLTSRIKAISLNVIAKFKAEIPEFDIDFESFVKELSTDDAVWISCGVVN